MKVFISVDMEGLTTTTKFEETEPGDLAYPLHVKQMENEVLAAIEGAKAAGATEVVVRDAHNTATNIDPTVMPSGVTLIRRWSGHPYSMAYGIDKSFDAAMFIGYHSGAGRIGNPMSHTLNGNIGTLTINDVLTSEFLLYSYACALEGVPTVFLSGDKTLCEDSQHMHPNLVTCSVKDASGPATINYSTKDTLPKIRALVEKALKQNLSSALVKLPNHFEAELRFKQQWMAEKAMWFPNVKRKSDEVVTYSSDNFFEILRTTNWIIR